MARDPSRPRIRQLILLAVSDENHCHYCAAVHSTAAKGALHIPAGVVAAIRNNAPVPDKNLYALVAQVKELVRERGTNHSELHRRWLQEGTGHGTAARHCPQGHQQLPEPHLARACRSGICGRE
jgi:alkylhydroperoxidase family enzyme